MSSSKGERRAQPVKLFIGGITRNTTTNTLREHFAAFGCVLDCVAMRQPDGRPRGFGYVTLDSPAAADACLAEPQVIDGRVVDMKRAVPEGSEKSPKSANLPTPLNAPMRVPLPGYYTPGLQSPCYASAALMAAGHASPHDFGQLTSTSLLSLEQAATHSLWPGLSHPDFATDLVSPTSRSTLGDAFALPSGPPALQVESPTTGKTNVAAVMSAEAAEFVPTLAPRARTAEIQSAAPPKPPGRVVGQLSDITNMVNNTDVIVQDANVKKPTAAPPMQEPTAKTAKRLSGSHTTMDILEDTQNEKHDEEIDENTPLPSMGSANHFAGTCKRCNFFAKGRCQNGQDCSFCHFPHDRRKFSRQEKRERRAMLEGGNVDDVDSASDSDLESTVTSPAMQAKMPPGLGQYKMPPALLGMPRSMPPGLEMFQPEEELSPTCNYTPLASPQSGHPLLSTVPCAAPAIKPMASPATEGVLPLGLACDDILAQAGGAASKTELVADLKAATTTDTLPSKVMCTIGTQTEAEFGTFCSRCRLSMSK